MIFAQDDLVYTEMGLAEVIGFESDSAADTTVVDWPSAPTSRVVVHYVSNEPAGRHYVFPWCIVSAWRYESPEERAGAAKKLSHEISALCRRGKEYVERGDTTMAQMTVRTANAMRMQLRDLSKDLPQELR